MTKYTKRGLLLTKQICIFSALVFTSPSTWADKVPLTALVGVNRNTMDTKEIVGGPTSSAQYSFHAGLTTDFALSEMFFFRTGAIYNQRNNTFTYPTGGGGGGGDVNVNYSYVDVPMHLLLQGKNFSLMAGVAIGVKVSGKPEGTSTWTHVIEDQTKATDSKIITPFQVGVGRIFKKRFEVQIIYELATPITKLQISNAPESEIKTSTISIRLGYTKF